MGLKTRVRRDSVMQALSQKSNTNKKKTYYNNNYQLNRTFTTCQACLLYLSPYPDYLSMTFTIIES